MIGDLCTAPWLGPCVRARHLRASSVWLIAALMLVWCALASSPGQAHASAPTAPQGRARVSHRVAPARGKADLLHSRKRSRSAPALGEDKKSQIRDPQRNVALAAPASDDVTSAALVPNRADRWARGLRLRASRAETSTTKRRLLAWADRLEYWLGSETMDTASFELTLSVIAKIPGMAMAGNAAFQLRKWFPSREYRREAASRGWKERIWGYTIGASAPLIGGAGYDSVTGWYMPGVSARGFGTGLGIPNYANVSFGVIDATKPTEYNRGSYGGVAAQIIPFGVGGVSLEANVYYRPMERITRYIEPVADKLRNAVRTAWRVLTGKPRAPSATPPSATPPPNDGVAVWRGGAHMRMYSLAT